MTSISKSHTKVSPLASQTIAKLRVQVVHLVRAQQQPSLSSRLGLYTSGTSSWTASREHARTHHRSTHTSWPLLHQPSLPCLCRKAVDTGERVPQDATFVNSTRSKRHTTPAHGEASWSQQRELSWHKTEQQTPNSNGWGIETGG